MFLTVDFLDLTWYNGFMEGKKYKSSRWVTVLLTAEAHRELTVIALDAETSLAKLSRAIFNSFLEGNKERQLPAISKAKEMDK